MFRFTIRDVLLVMAIVGLAVGWWMDHRMAEYRCNGICNPIEDYADRLNLELHSAKLEMFILKETLIQCLVNQGKPEDEMRELLAKDSVNWSILDERKPYSNPCYPPLKSWFYPWK